MYEDLEMWCENVSLISILYDVGKDNSGSDSTGCSRIKVRTDTAELTNMRIAGLRK